MYYCIIAIKIAVFVKVFARSIKVMFTDIVVSAINSLFIIYHFIIILFN